MKADRSKLEQLFLERAALQERLKQIDESIVYEQSLCTCPDLITMPNGEKVCPDCFYTWSVDY
ncbi:hypothetical protein [Paenibacillus hamazuiensis]|uniref:hypothetical protein n=1 Tax=Paenibacillus hamazuiensis TaxID=2936508 RepID=UPI00200D413B|nr:hypothetical protein [Paenibacillus hamazuiensis]